MANSWLTRSSGQGLRSLTYFTPFSRGFSVTRLGEISPFGLLFRDRGIYCPKSTLILAAILPNFLAFFAFESFWYKSGYFLVKSSGHTALIAVEKRRCRVRTQALKVALKLLLITTMPPIYLSMSLPHFFKKLHPLTNVGFPINISG